MERRKVIAEDSKDLEVLYEVIDLFANQFSREEELAIIIDSIYKQPYIQSCGVLLWDVSKKHFSFAVSRGLSKEYLDTFSQKHSSSQLEKIGQSSAVMILHSADSPEKEKLKFEKNYETMILLPLKSEGALVGLMYVESLPGHPYGLKESNILNTFAVLTVMSLTRAGLAAKVENLEMLDDLTALYDMPYFRKRLQTEYKRAIQKKVKISLMIVNIDGYDDYLEQHGETKTNKAVIEIATLLRNNLRTIDVLGRYSMNQVVVSLYDCSPKNCCKVAERVVRGMRHIQIVPAEPLLKLSIGIAGSSIKDIKTPDDLLDCAEESVFSAFAFGGNTVKLYTTSK